MISREFLGPYLGTNIVSAALVFSAIKWPRLTRVLFVVIFVAAGLFNTYTALTQPDVYLDYGDMAVLDVYRQFINGFFSEHTQAIVLAIALGQLSVGALLTGGGHPLRMGVAGGVIFFIAITPLGVGSAFPATLLMAVALIVMQRRLAQDEVKKTQVKTQ
jgi:hypothetical protein